MPCPTSSSLRRSRTPNSGGPLSGSSSVGSERVGSFWEEPALEHFWSRCQQPGNHSPGAPRAFVPGGRQLPSLASRPGTYLDEMHLGVVRLVVNEMVAGRAVPAGLDRGTARGVPGRLRRVGVPGPPVRQQAERPREFLAFGGQLVGGAGRPLGVRPGHEQRFPFEPLEALGQDVRRDTGDLARADR